MRFGNYTLLSLFGALFWLSASANETPEMGDFDFGWQVNTTIDANLYEIELPFEFYQAVTDLSLRDVGVFDSSGQPVPRLIKLPPAPSRKRVYKTRAFKLFPVFANPATGATPGKLVFQQTGDETVLTFDGGIAAPPDDNRRVESYVIDARSLKKTLNRLELAWPATEQPFIAQVTVDGSSDLENWRQLGQGSIAELRQGNSLIARRFVNLSSGRTDYLRIRWDEVPSGWRLESARGRYFEKQNATKTVVNRLQQVTSSGKDKLDKGYLFDMGGAPRVDQIQLTLPADNTVIKAVVYADPNGQGRWQRVGENIFYNLRRGNQTIQNEPLNVKAFRARHWKIVVASGRSDMELIMTARWQPDQLRFVAQGRGPYQVAAGRREAMKAGFPMDSKFGDASIFKVSRVAGRAQAAQLGSRIELRGRDKTLVPSIVEWRQWLLWIALVVGVLVVATMAFRLLRQLNSD